MWDFQFISQKELKRMTHEVEGEGYRSVVRLVPVSERLGFIGGLFVEVDGAIAGQQVLLPANAV